MLSRKEMFADVDPAHPIAALSLTRRWDTLARLWGPHHLAQPCSAFMECPPPQPPASCTSVPSHPFLPSLTLFPTLFSITRGLFPDDITTGHNALVVTCLLSILLGCELLKGRLCLI